MTAFRTRAFVSLLFALLLALLVAFAEGGAVARADTPAARADRESEAASAGQNDWSEDAQSREPQRCGQRCPRSSRCGR